MPKKLTSGVYANVPSEENVTLPWSAPPFTPTSDQVSPPLLPGISFSDTLPRKRLFAWPEVESLSAVGGQTGKGFTVAFVPLEIHSYSFLAVKV